MVPHGDRIIHLFLPLSDLNDNHSGVGWGTGSQSFIGLTSFSLPGSVWVMEITIGGLRLFTDGSLLDWDGRDKRPFVFFCVDNNIALTDSDLDELNSWLDDAFPWLGNDDVNMSFLGELKEIFHPLYSTGSGKTHSYHDVANGDVDVANGDCECLDEPTSTVNFPHNISVLLRAVKASSPFMWEHHPWKLLSDGFYGNYFFWSEPLMRARNPSDVSVALCGDNVRAITHKVPTALPDLLSCLSTYAQYIDFSHQDIEGFLDRGKMVPEPHPNIGEIAGMMSTHTWVKALTESSFEGIFGDHLVENNKLRDIMDMMSVCSDSDISLKG